MGFKLKNIFKPVAKAIDPLLPEKVKDVAVKLDDTLGGMSMAGSILSGVQNPDQGESSTAAATTAASTGAITEEEAQALSQKRLARLGKYFTSPLGVLGGASTASQKVFS